MPVPSVRYLIQSVGRTFARRYGRTQPCRTRSKFRSEKGGRARYRCWGPPGCRCRWRPAHPRQPLGRQRTKSLSVRRKSLTSAWRRSMSSTKRTREPPRSYVPATVATAAAAAAAATRTASEVVTAATAATAATEAASELGSAAAAAAAAAEAGPVGYGPDLAGFGLANESASESKNIQHALELRSSSREASGAAPGNTDRA
jgi:hypothetical protein